MLALAFLLTIAWSQTTTDHGVRIMTFHGIEARAPNPKAGGVFRIACRVDIDEHGVPITRFLVHAPLTEHAAFAAKAGRFLASLWRLSDKRFGTLCARLREKTVELWLTMDGQAGGEQINNNIYVYDFLSTRTELEWARELAHEYGHYLLPSPSGYSAPESWANGVLGERLFLKWLRDDGEQPVFATHRDLQEYCEKQSDALIERYRQSPPDRALLAAADRKAFDAYTGLMLYADAVYGGASIMHILSYMPQAQSGNVRGTDFLAGLTAWLNDAQKVDINLLSSPMNVFIPNGRFRLGPERPKVKLPPTCRLDRIGNDWKLTSYGSSWTRIQLESPAPQILKLERIP
jgi:hypothetical protein